ncbi:MAG: hypothetical protein H7Y17_01680 [Chlorobia bacterium]|nr:hypothetical protein [Fimbriimonadaceae bacterium]
MLCLLASAILAPQAAPKNLVYNGDFSLGVKGFTTHYSFSEDIYKEGTYVVGDDPKKHHGGGFSMGDHTSGKGRMMIVNGGSFANDSIWEARVKVAAGLTYEFTGWAASWSMNPHDGTATDLTPGRFQIYIDGKPTGAVYKVDAKGGHWGKFTIPWKSDGARSVDIKIVNTNTSELGNDFAIDDLWFGIKQEKKPG